MFIIGIVLISGLLYWLAWELSKKKCTDWMWDQIMEITDFIYKEKKGK